MDLTLVRRVFREKRRIVLPLTVVAAINAAAYALLVVPLATRVSTAEARARAAETTLRAAEQEYQAARGAAEGKDLAQQELKKFYGEILPGDLPGARRITYLRLAQLARQSTLQYRRRDVEAARERDSSLNKLQITMVLEGQYSDVRRFLYELETSPEFIVIENVALAEGSELGAPLVLTLDLSTYFRSEGGDGAPAVPPSKLPKDEQPSSPAETSVK